MKKLSRALFAVILIFSMLIPASAFEAQDKLTAPPDILSFTVNEDMTQFTVSFTHSLAQAEELREFVYGLALEEYKTEEALLASPEKYLACKTRLYLELSADSYSWSAVRELTGDDFSLTAKDICTLLNKTEAPSRAFIRICLASENILIEGTQRVYIYAPSEAAAIYFGENGTLIPTGESLVFSKELASDYPLFTPSVKGYIFDGWSGEDGQRINAIPRGSQKTVIRAHFIPLTYEINYVLTTDITYPFGRADNTKNPTQYEVGAGAKIYSIASPVIGYTFGGWYSTPDFSGEKITEIKQGETGDRILYARWISDAQKEQEKLLERQQYIKDNKLGDPDGDGKITASDARYVLRAAVGLEAPDYEKLKRVDYFNTNKISAENARTTLRISVGLDSLYDILLENGLLP